MTCDPASPESGPCGERARTLFSRHSLRCTRQRIEVYDALASTKAHPTAEELHRMVEARSPGMSLATVYNTLEVLCGAGLARRVPTAGNSPARYDADTSPHLHLVAEDGQVMDVPHDLAQEILASLPGGMERRLAERFGKRLSHVSIQLGSDGAAERRSDEAD